MKSLATLKNVTRPKQARKRVGRGLGSGLGKTSGRGEKGAGARSGYKRRHGYEGGQFRTFMKLPIRGFSNESFRKRLDFINLNQISELYADGEVVSIETLVAKGFLAPTTHGIKILGNGELTKKVTIEADAVSSGAREKLKKAKVDIKLPE
jgi:large subunit ribosomal protein L15